jgi:hypothetical protein
VVRNCLWFGFVLVLACVSLAWVVGELGNSGRPQGAMLWVWVWVFHWEGDESEATHWVQEIASTTMPSPNASGNPIEVLSSVVHQDPGTSAAKLHSAFSLRFPHTTN